ncbi:MAG: hypothetical protein P0Y66_08505 [Candidatus Kaistia colombiensis]|nr:MAG: hypothetical protein P0Y66_08505 [Kaistia sp.]
MDPKKPIPDPLPPSHPVPDIDERANQAFLDSLIDTDGRPMRDAIDMAEEDDDDEDATDEDIER